MTNCGTFLHDGEIHINAILETGMLVSRLIRLLKSPKKKGSLRGEELQMNCSKCGNRPATDPMICVTIADSLMS